MEACPWAKKVRPCLKNNQSRNGCRLAEAVEYLPRKRKGLSSTVPPKKERNQMQYKNPGMVVEAISWDLGSKMYVSQLRYSGFQQ
jgi:hypothetical protein